MGLVSGAAVFFITWWTVLFVVLPLGISPDPEGAEAGGWRGAPRQVRVGRIVLLTTVLAILIWLGIDQLVRAEWTSFREGWLAMPER